MIASCYANPNWDGKDNADKRSQYLKDINVHFNRAITALYAPRDRREVDVDWDNPFFAAHKREIERTKALFDQAKLKGATAGEAVDRELAEQNGRGDFDQEIPRNR